MLAHMLIFSFAILAVSVLPVSSQGYKKGYKKVNTNDPDVKKAANEAVREISIEQETHLWYKLLGIYQAYKKMDNEGTKYEMKIYIGEAACPREDVPYEDIGDCETKLDANDLQHLETDVCVVNILKDKNNKYKLLDHDC